MSAEADSNLKDPRHFVSAISPGIAPRGSIWFKTTDATLWVSDGAAWIQVT